MLFNSRNNTFQYNKSMLYGVNLARELIIHSKKHIILRLLEISLFIGFIRWIIPIMYRVYMGTAALGESSIEIYIVIASVLCNTYFYGANLAFILVGISDLSIKRFLMC